MRILSFKAAVTFIFLLLVFFTATAVIPPSDTARQTIPYTLPWDDMPIDLSFIYEDEKPAGKHGFLKANNEKFIFEDGTEARFWGTNFNSQANFPSHEHSKIVARRLAKTGVNMVRFHQLDAEWSVPNIFQFAKGRNPGNTMQFDSLSMDRLDYLVHCLKQEGIYVFLDLLTYRRFKSGDGVRVPEKLENAAKPYSNFDPRLIELQKKFNHDLWTHMNPYTGLAYKDDPAIALTGISNENDLFSQNVTMEPYRSELEVIYRKWASTKKISLNKEKVEFKRDDRNVLEFFIELQSKYYIEMIGHLRKTGVKVPVSGSNWSRGVALLSSLMATDFTDSHAYWYTFGIWKGTEKKFQNSSMTGSTGNMLPSLAFNRVKGKPFFVSEWENPWPNEWRAESVCLLAAAGAFQGWGGYCIHTYRYSNDESTDMIGKPITSNALGSVYYRGGVFDTFNDPAKFGLFYHAALILRRGDVKPALNTADIIVEDISSSAGIRALRYTPEKHRAEMVLPGMKSDGHIQYKADQSEQDVNEIFSDTREMYRNLEKKYGWIDTPFSKVVYGFSGGEEISLTGARFRIQNDFATVAISSLTDEPLSHSSNMLLTVVGRADNTGSRYNEDHTLQLDPGHGPVQVEVISGIIEINTDSKNLRVLSVNPQGMITGEIPSTSGNGVFRFEIGKEFQSMYYLIQEI